MTKLTRRDALRTGSGLAAFLPFANACAPSNIETETSPETGFIDAVRMSELLESGDMTAQEAVETAINRAETVEPEINAISHKSYDMAREMAANIEGRMAGVPTFIKDLDDWEGLPTLYGSRAFKGYVASADEPISRAWRKAGLIPIGKSTSPEMGLTATTEPLVTGPTRNPWNVNHSAGGSSGGAGALVAARVTPFAHATDGGGSIRIPASCNGVFGLKPSRDRTWFRHTQPPVSISCSHATSITVRDSAALFRLTQSDAYPDIGDITGPSTKRLRIGLITESPTGTTDPEIVTATEAAATLCEALGHEVREVSLPETFDIAAYQDAFSLYWASGAAQFAGQASAFTGKPPSPEIVEPLTLFLAGIFQARRDEIQDKIAYLTAFEAAYNAWFSDIDVLLTPVLTKLPFQIGEVGPMTNPEEHFAKISEYAAFTSMMNTSGAASMSVPLAWSESGLPIGIMFSGKRGDDGLLLKLAYELEAAQPWVDKIPPVHAG